MSSTKKCAFCVTSRTLLFILVDESFAIQSALSTVCCLRIGASTVQAERSLVADHELERAVLTLRDRISRNVRRQDEANCKGLPPYSAPVSLQSLYPCRRVSG